MPPTQPMAPYTFGRRHDQAAGLVRPVAAERGRNGFSIPVHQYYRDDAAVKDRGRQSVNACRHSPIAPKRITLPPTSERCRAPAKSAQPQIERC